MAATPTLSVLPGGVYTALVPPFRSDADAVDEVTLVDLVEQQVAAGVAGVVVVRFCAGGAFCSCTVDPTTPAAVRLDRRVPHPQ